MAAAADSTPVAITLPGSDDYTWIAGSNASGIGTGATASIVESLATAIDNADLGGWYAGTGQAYGANDYGTDISISSSGTFSFKSRPALSGEYVALGVALPVAADSITLSFDTTNKLGYSVWSYNGTTATELIGLTYQGNAGSVSQTYDTGTVNASQLFVLWTANHPTGNAGGGTTVTVSNIALSYTPAVPEPATATLSLLALAGLAARRRRK
ncbi:MAG: PEP-CTERM sorting domain-containing protein [Akkermansia sp.]|nr:PEP-CTERM sorting domain-containing protein [Akkermansia sp.]